MEDKELYRQKYQARLDELKADVAKLKARAAGARADVRIEMNKRAAELDQRLHEASAKLAELAAAGEGTWDAARRKAETTWDALKAGVSAAAAKFKD